MRILQLGPVPPEAGGIGTGGVATHAWKLSTHLAERGHEVAIAADNFRASSELPVNMDGVKIYGTCYAPRVVLRQGVSLLSNTPTLVKLTRHCWGMVGPVGIGYTFAWYEYVIRAFRPEIVHVHHLERRFPFAHYAARRKHTPVVTTVHSTTSVKFATGAERERNLRFIKKNAHLARDIVFGFKTRMNEFLSLLDEDEKTHLRCWLVPYPMDSSLYFPLPRSEACLKLGMSPDRTMVLFAANLVPLKGAATLLMAVALLARRQRELGFDVIIVGGGPQHAELAEAIQQYGLEPYVKLVGPKTPADLLYYYNAAALFVLPSKEEALPTTAFEAIQCGCPVVVSTNVAPEMLPPPDIAHSVPPDDERALAAAIEVCLKRKWDREKISDYIRQFDWHEGTAANVTRFEELYLRLTEKAQ